MWCDALLLDKPIQHRSRTVSGIARKPFRLETEALLCSVDHGPGRADLSLANGAGCLNVNLHCAAGPSRIAIPMPILTSDRALLVGIGLDQARIDGKAFTTNQAGRNARSLGPRPERPADAALRGGG